LLLVFAVGRHDAEPRPLVVRVHSAVLLVKCVTGDVTDDTLRLEHP
jgi:hypothetical protein